MGNVCTRDFSALSSGSGRLLHALTPRPLRDGQLLHLCFRARLRDGDDRVRVRVSVRVRVNVYWFRVRVRFSV